MSRLLSCSLPALACEFEVAGLAPGPRLISAILEYAILAGSLLSPYLRARRQILRVGLDTLTTEPLILGCVREVES